MAQVVIPTPLRKFTGNRSSVNTEGTTVKENIDQLARTYPDLAQHLYEEDGSLRDFVRIYVGDEDINVLDKEATAVTEDSVISIVPAIAGGCSVVPDLSPPTKGGEKDRIFRVPPFPKEIVKKKIRFR